MSETRLRIQLFDQDVLPYLCTRPLHGSDFVWRTGDRLAGQIVVNAPADSQFGKLAVSLIGIFHIFHERPRRHNRLALTCKEGIIAYGSGSPVQKRFPSLGGRLTRKVFHSRSN